MYVLYIKNCDKIAIWKKISCFPSYAFEKATMPSCVPAFKMNTSPKNKFSLEIVVLKLIILFSSVLQNTCNTQEEHKISLLFQPEEKTLIPLFFTASYRSRQLWARNYNAAWWAACFSATKRLYKADIFVYEASKQKENKFTMPV